MAIHGNPKFIEDRQWLEEHLGALSEQHERTQSMPWSLDDAPEDFLDKLLQGVIGVEIPISRIEGKWKTNQTSTEGDKKGVISGLLDNGGEEARAMALLVEQTLRD